MIAKRIQEQAQLHVDDDFPWIHGRRWINEALGLLVMFCEHGTSVVETIEIITNGSGYHPLPDDCIRIKTVYKDKIDKDNIINDYVEDGKQVYLQDGIYSLQYYRKAKDILLDSDIPEVHELYHIPISYWVASREKLRFNPQDSDGQRLLNEFYTQIKLVDIELGKSNRVRKIKV